MDALAVETSVNAGQRIEELGRIILAYSEITEKLQLSHERLEQTVLTLREELSEKNRLLERKNRLAALGEMAAGIAHEIRNPLGGIQLYASLLAKDVADRPAAADVVRKISAGVRHLEGLVSQVLQFTREMAVNIGEADLAEVVSEAVELASGKGARVQVQGPSTLAVKVDGQLIRQVVLNLVLNAIDAINDEGTVKVEFGPPREGEAKEFWLAVTDDGHGIPAGIMEKIFHPFFTTRDQGTGLGLAIVHRVVELHNGSITASNLEDGGARFEIRI